MNLLDPKKSFPGVSKSNVFDRKTSVVTNEPSLHYVNLEVTSSKINLDSKKVTLTESKKPSTQGSARKQQFIIPVLEEGLSKPATRYVNIPVSRPKSKEVNMKSSITITDASEVRMEQRLSRNVGAENIKTESNELAPPEQSFR